MRSGEDQLDRNVLVSCSGSEGLVHGGGHQFRVNVGQGERARVGDDPANSGHVGPSSSLKRQPRQMVPKKALQPPNRRGRASAYVAEAVATGMDFEDNRREERR